MSKVRWDRLHYDRFDAECTVTVKEFLE